MFELSWKEIEIGGIVAEPGNARKYKTGGWRSERPIHDKEKCNLCGLCYIFCPDGCIFIDEEGNFDADLDYCKGCGICARECPQEAVEMVEEVE
jgi:pyruvate ferredoxin oxidoreductase delta subunit